MPMLDIQRRHASVFRIRLGEKGSRGEPRKLTDQIRVTSAGRNVVEAFTEAYGGAVQPWEGQFEAYLPVTALPICVLPGESLTQWWELWRGTVCERRCDGFTESLSGDRCLCPSDVDARMAAKGACRPMTRVSVLCPEVAVVGAGSLVTHGLIAAQTLPQSIAVAEAALSRGVMVPAVLRVVEHKGRRHFIVPQIEVVGVSLNSLTTGEAPARIPVSAPVAAELASPAPALEAAPAVPAADRCSLCGDPYGDAPLVRGADGQSKWVHTACREDGDPPEPEPEPEAEPVPVVAKPVPRPTPPPPPLPNELEADPDAPDSMTQQQSRKLHLLLRKQGVVGPQRHTWATAALERPITSFSEISKVEGGLLIDLAEAEAAEA